MSNNVPTNKIRYGRDYMELHFHAKWSLVQSLWDYLRGLVGSFLRDSKRSEVISVAIIELLENSVKYSLKDEDGKSLCRFRLKMESAEKIIHVEVENPCDPKHYEILKKEYDRIESHPDKRKLFLDKIREAATREDGKSQLGLVRIIIEAQAKMSFELVKGNIIVHAKFKMTPGGN